MLLQLRSILALPKRQRYPLGVFQLCIQATLIKNTLVEGRVRLGADMYNDTESHDLAYRSDYMMHFDAAGGDIADQPIPREQMFSLSEDGIRIYTDGGSARVENTTVMKTRGGIRLYLGSDGEVINSTAIDCGSTNFNLPNGGTITGSSGNFACMAGI